MNQVFTYQISAWFRDNMPLVGCFIIGVSSILIALSGILKIKGDKAGASRKKEENAKSKQFYIQYGFALVACFLWTVYGTWLTKHAGDVATRAEFARAEKQHQIDTDKLAKMSLDFRQEFKTVLAKLNAANQGESQKITDEKIHVLKSDLSEWMGQFVTNMPAEKNWYLRAKSDLETKQKQDEDKVLQLQKERTALSYPVFSFAIRFLQEAVRTYAVKIGNTNIVIDLIELPENLNNNPLNASIHFNTNTAWKINTITGWTPEVQFGGDYDLGQPYLRFTFSDGHSTTGELNILLNPKADKMILIFTTSLPSPNPDSIQGQYDMSDFDAILKDALQRIVKAQLLQMQGS